MLKKIEYVEEEKLVSTKKEINNDLLVMIFAGTSNGFVFAHLRDIFYGEVNISILALPLTLLILSFIYFHKRGYKISYFSFKEELDKIVKNEKK